MENLKTAREAWEALLSEVGEERMTLPGANGEWAVKDVIVHIMWGEREMVGVIQARALVGSELWELTDDERNPIIVAPYRDVPLKDVQAEEQQVYGQFLAVVEQLSDEDLNDASHFRLMPPTWLPWQVLAGDSFKHYYDHIEPISAWLREQVR
jgi:hypothetical protein